MNASAKQADKPVDQTIKETIESIIIAFILAFVFRAFVVEAFQIPSGSMAPTLLGRHLEIVDVETGYRFPIDSAQPDNVGAVPAISEKLRIYSPMSMQDVAPNKPQRIRGGDRILVHKYIYSLPGGIASPRRWDVIVFKNPTEPYQNFIKRLTGLPGETLAVIEGDLYVKPASDNAWQIARKTDPSANPNWEKIQRALWQPIHDSDYLPVYDTDPHVPWNSRSLPPVGSWTFEGGRGYRHESDGKGEIFFDFSRYQRWALPWYTYNQVYLNPVPAQELHPISDYRLALVARPANDNFSLVLHGSIRATNQPKLSPLELTISQGKAQLTIEDAGISTSADVTDWQQGKAVDVELWVVDQEVLVWMNDRVVLRQAIDLPVHPDSPGAGEKGSVWNRVPLPNNKVPKLAIAVEGQAELFNIRVDRDIYYLSNQVAPDGRRFAENQNLNPYRGCIAKDVRDDKVYIEAKPVTLDPGTYFAMGDNSPLSSDGRMWQHVNPWIHEMYLRDKKQFMGVVPEELLIGRAFFVYYPAPYGLNDQSFGFIPNFGQMRVIH